MGHAHTLGSDGDANNEQNNNSHYLVLTSFILDRFNCFTLVWLRGLEGRKEQDICFAEAVSIAFSFLGLGEDGN